VAGVDVSSYQGPVDWKAVKAGGVTFAYIRASEQAHTPDATFPTNDAGARAQGFLVGAYHRAKPDASPGASQADYFIDHADVRADGHTLPPVLDMESPRSGWTSPSGRPLNACYNMTPAQIVSWTRAFLAEVIARTGRLGVLYTGAGWWTQCTNANTTFAPQPLWLPRYAASPLPLPAGWAHLTFWQYTSSGRLPSGVAVDQDVFRGDAGALTQLAQGTTVITLLAQADNRYVTAESAGRLPLIANRTAAGRWERFRLLTNADGSNSLQALVNGKFVTAEHAGAGALIANRDRVGPWERFKLILNSDGTFSLRALVNGKFVTAENAGAAPLIANRSSIGKWEKFALPPT
jgi:GH25 family lysozyme M1 (1,4-beta-N-acetylmuramidase)